MSSGDYGKVQIKIEGATDWVDISTSYTSTGSNIWTYPSIDLSDYAGETVQIAFYFHSVDTYFGNVSTGWYIDNVEVITGPIDFNTPEDWENGIGDWASERGTWEVGTPSVGPGAAYDGQQCAATVLEGNYSEPVDSRLESPKFTVPAASENPRLRFWHWYSMSSGDYGKVQIKIEGATDWEDISTSYTSTGSNIWTYTYFPLSDYAGETVQIAFYFHSVDTYFGNISTGWYIDNVIIESDLTSDETDILSFGFGTPPQTGDANINSSLHTIDIEVEAGTDVTNLISTFTLSDGATAKVGDVDQESGVTANNFQAR